MEREWPGQSERDKAIEEYLRERLGRSPRRPCAELPATLLLGPRGSGKTTLLRHLAEWADRVPVSRLDLAALGQQGGKPLDALAQIVFDLNTPKKAVPQLTFPSFGLLVTAAVTRVSARDRDTAVTEMRAALAGPDSGRSTTLNRLAESVATAAGAPELVTAALPLLPEWQLGWARFRTRRRLARIRRGAPHLAPDAFLLRLNQLYGEAEGAERARAEAVLVDAFLDDLRRAYTSRSGNRRRTTRCLLLLDNADSPLGNALLEILLAGREKADEPDPLLILATAGSYPRLLRGSGFRAAVRSGRQLGGWSAQQDAFTPEELGRGLHAGELCDLNGSEVERQVGELVRAVGLGVPKPHRVENVVRWLGRTVHEVTRGHPAATAAVLDALADHEDSTPWEDRLRRVFSPSYGLVDQLLERLLPHDLSGRLRERLPLAAAPADLAQARTASGLWGGAPEAVLREFDEFRADPLRTLRTAVTPRDGAGRTDPPHPVLRLLLLRRLAALPAPPGGGTGPPDDESGPPGDDDGHPTEGPWGTGAWGAAHAALRRAAERAGAEGTVAYHRLAVGDLPAAARHLNALYGRTTAEEWCAELCRLRRAPVRPPEGGAEEPWQRYEALVDHLNVGAVDGQLRTITRLLAASWLSTEPLEDPVADQVGDPFRDPLGDPGAELHGEIAARFRTLAAHAHSVGWTPVLLDMAARYDGRPWGD
ncbi:ATP-binding protein [Streptomyces sp. AJS327]|uniref:ATP-binding protein n=1 Tax=Streptomyces sp. AJS327 TaxID=2545265 RepID=UPI0015DFFCEB|nr:ATP-binding protein [Streptomyces sp. AJS327]MBA0051874.1 ATP-binding protein [Streptomyces sp. AJS327]